MPLLEKLCSSPRLARWALAPSLALAFANPAHADADEDSPAGVDDSPREQAKAAVQRGQRAFQAEDYAAAIVAFDEANHLRPTPKLDYNLGICHQRLHARARSDGTYDAERLHANAAIDAYNRYLAARPTADDRPVVEDLIRGLGGTPVTAAALKPAPKPPPAGETPAQAPTSGDSADDGRTKSQDPAPSDMSQGDDPVRPPEPAGTSAVALPRGSLVAGLALWSIPQMNAHPTVEAASMGALLIRAGVHFGARRWLFVGAGLAVAGVNNTQTTSKLGSAAQTFDALVGIHLPVGRGGRLVIPMTGILGAGREALRTRADIPRPACASGSGTLVGARWGGRIGARAGVLIFLGERRNHGLNIDLDGVANLYGRGPVADDCSQSVFQELAVPRARASIGVSLGYGVRF